MSNEPIIPQKSPIPIEVEAGKKYAWCACGRSQNQPFCDGTHKGQTELRPLIVTFEENKKVWWCGCKHTSNELGLCDGTHKNLND